MSYNRKYYLKHKDEWKAKQLEYYYQHKEEIAAKIKAKKEAEKAAGIVKETKPKGRPKVEKPLTEKQKQKQFINSLKSKFKGFDFELDGDIMTIEIKLPFRIIIEKYGTKHCDDAEYQKIQNELRRKVYPMCKKQHLIVIECQYLQLFISKEENIEELCNTVRDFVKKKLEIYGKYKKSGRFVGADFE